MKNILDAIGNTPLIKIEKLGSGFKFNIFAKIETVNPSGSIKDRIAKYMIEKAEKRGELKPGHIIIEATSGNTGISFAMLSAVKGYKMLAVMPENISEQKKALMKIFGAKIILTPQKENLAEAIKKAERLAKKYKKAWLPRQFENPDNIEAHKKSLGREILKQIENRKIDAFTAGIGTGGTLMGTAAALKERFPEVKIFGVEAAESRHQIEGISDGIVPKLLDFSLIDGMLKIKSEEAIETAKALAQKEGLSVGISSGANILAAIKIAEKYKFKNIVTVLPDRGERYLDLLKN